tara:strand:- start:247 stop:1101 length:855 start_codon:yes stop_codon:yes gene_type:complete
MKIEEAESDITIEEEVTSTKVEGQEDAGDAGEAPDAKVEAAPDEVVISIGEEPPPHDEEESKAPEWVRELRKNHRKLQRENRELQEKLNAKATEIKPAVGKKPTLEDFDYDSDKYEEALSSWLDLKRKADDEVAKAKQVQEDADKTWQAKLENYGKAKSELKVPDFEDAEDEIRQIFDVTQQGIIIHGADNPAIVNYALGKNQGKAKELAAIKDPVQFAFAVAKLEATLKVTNKKSIPPPEKVISGTGRVSGSVDSTLERLRAEAEKSGDYTKVTQYKRQKLNK